MRFSFATTSSGARATKFSLFNFPFTERSRPLKSAICFSRRSTSWSILINPESGMVEGVIDFSGLKDRVNQHSKLDVLNGIAYNKKRGTFFVTGKNWSKLFELKIYQKN